MATQKTARGQITIVDLNDARAINLFLSANHPLTQIESQLSDESHQFSPDYTTDSLQINPELLVSGMNAQKFSKAPKWYVNGVLLTPPGTAGHEQSDVEGEWSIGGTSGTNNYPLTITKNLSSIVMQYDIVCEGTYADTMLQVEYPISAHITISRLVNSGELIFAYIKGTSFFGYGYQGPDPASITLEAQLVRGGIYDNTDNDFTTDWFYEYPAETDATKKDSLVDGFQKITLTSAEMDGSSTKVVNENRIIVKTTESGEPVWLVKDYTGGQQGDTLLKAKGNHLIVYPDAVDGSERFRADITDTKVGSVGEGHTFKADFKEIMDYSDPFVLVMKSSAGDKFKNGVGVTTLTAQLTSGSNPVQTGKYTCTFHWYKYNADGDIVPNWSPAVNDDVPAQNVVVTNTTGVSTLKISQDDVDVRSTFVCEVQIENV